MVSRRVTCASCSAQLDVEARTVNFRCPCCQTLCRIQPAAPPSPPPCLPQGWERPSPMAMFGSAPSSRGRKKAVLCGVSYNDQPFHLPGSVNDVERMRFLLTDRMGFRDDCIFVLTEDETNPKKIPTKLNMERALRWLVQGSQAGDSLLFYFSGHGMQVCDEDDEADGFDESLCPMDFAEEGVLVDDDINDLIVAPLPTGAKLHAIIDASHSGSVLDLPFTCKMNRHGHYVWTEEQTGHDFKGSRGGLAVSITACDDHETARDTKDLIGCTTGALTNSFIKAVETAPGLTYGHLLSAVRCSIQQVGYGGACAPHKQEPQMSSTHKFEIYTRKFIV